MTSSMRCATAPRAANRRRRPSIARSTSSLQEDFVHRIDTRNAYMACFAPQRRHRSHVLLCRRCGCAAEIEHGAIDRALARAAADAGFARERETVEIAGLCAACAEISPEPSMPPPTA